MPGMDTYSSTPEAKLTSEMLEAFKMKVRDRIRELGLTRNEVAIRMRMERVSAWRILCSPKNLTTATVAKVAIALECDPGWLQTPYDVVTKKPKKNSRRYC